MKAAFVVLFIIIQIAVFVFGITYVANYLASHSIIYQLLICVAAFILALVGAVYRGEDKFQPGPGKPRHFMTFGHSSVLSAIILILIKIFT